MEDAISSTLCLSENWKLCCHNLLLQHSHRPILFQDIKRAAGWLSERALISGALQLRHTSDYRPVTNTCSTLSVFSQSDGHSSAFVILPPRFLLPLPTSNTPVLPPSHSWIFQQERTVIKFWLLLTCYKMPLRRARTTSEVCPSGFVNCLNLRRPYRARIFLEQS